MAVTLVQRTYRGEADYDRLSRFVTMIQPLAAPAPYCTIGDLEWWRWTDDAEVLRSIALWENAAGELVGFAWPNDDEVDLVVHPDYPEVDAAMIAWAESHRRKHGPTLTAWANESHSSRLATLRQRGYERIDKAYLIRQRLLSDPIPPLVLPPGYSLRHVQGEADIDARVAVHRDAFAPSRMTAHKHRSVMGAATYRPELDLVVVAPDQSFAAFAIVWYDAANRFGLFEPVGTHSAHRRLGLGTAILTEGMRRLVALGAESAIVASLADSLPANALYDAVGLVAVDRCGGWRRTL